MGRNERSEVNDFSGRQLKQTTQAEVSGMGFDHTHVWVTVFLLFQYDSDMIFLLELLVQKGRKRSKMPLFYSI